MKIYIDLENQAITKIDNQNIYEGDIYANSFECYFFNFSSNDWFPTLSQLGPNNREAGDFTADSLAEDESHETTENGVNYLHYTFTMNEGYVQEKGRSNFYIWFNRSNPLVRKCVGRFNVNIDKSNNNYFVSDPAFNPRTKEYIDAEVAKAKQKISLELEDAIDDLVGGEPGVVDTAAHILAYTENKGICLGSDTGHYYYWNGTQYVDGGVYLSNYGLYYATFTDSDISSFDSEYISGGSITTPTYNVLECDLEASFIAKLTSDDYTLGIDFDTLGDGEDIDFVVSGFAYLTKTSKATGTYTYDFISDLPITATVSKFISQRDNERVCVSFIHITGTDATKYFILVERMLDYEIVEIDNSSFITGYSEYDLVVVIASGSSCLGATIKPVLHQIIDEVEQSTNLITLLPSDELVKYGATISIDNSGNIGFYTANGGSVTNDILLPIAKVLLPVGTSDYKLSGRFTIITGHANFGVGLKLSTSSLDPSNSVIAISHDFTTTLAATADEEATESIEVTSNNTPVLKREYTPILEKGNCVLRVKKGTTALGANDYDLNLSYVIGFSANYDTLVKYIQFSGFKDAYLTYGGAINALFARAGGYYILRGYNVFGFLYYNWDSYTGSLYNTNGDVTTPEFSTDTTPTEDSTNPIQSGAVYTGLGLKADKSTTYTKTEVDGEIATTKQYIDTSIQKLRWELSSHTLDVSSDTSVAYEKQVPNNTIGCQVNKLGGMSYKSNNLIGLPDTPETTVGGITYKIENGVVTFSGTSNQQYGTNIWILLTSPIPSGYTIAYNPFKSDASYNFIYLGKTINVYQGNIHMYQSGTTTTTEQFNYLLLQFPNNTTYTTTTVQPMVIRGSTEPTTYQAYFSGIKDNKVSAIYSWGANLLKLNDVASTTTNDVTYKVENGVITFSGVASANFNIALTINLSLTSGSYTHCQMQTFPSGLSSNLGINGSAIDGSNQALNYSRTFSAASATTSTTMYFVFVSGTNVNGLTLSPMVVRGSTEPTTYLPYNSNLIDTLDIYDSIQALTGYGWGINDTCYNYIDFDRKVFVQKVGRVDLGSLTYTKYDVTEGTLFRASLPSMKYDNTTNLLCANYTSILSSNRANGTISKAQTGTSTIDIIDNSYSDATTFKTAMNGVYLYYELATPVETDLNYGWRDTIDVEPLGVLRFDSANDLPVPSDLDYLIEVAD